ncbi:hypothetical protein EST38_g14685, partial [Candolleomyces aberdarensis]
RKGSTGYNPNEVQPPRKQLHVDPEDYSQEGNRDLENDEDFYDPSNPSEQGGSMDMNLDDQTNETNPFTFTPPFTQHTTGEGVTTRSASPSLFSDIHDSDTEDPPTDNKEPITTPAKQETRAQKPLPPPRNSTINGHTVPASQLTPPPHKGFPQAYGVTAKGLTDAITTTTKKVWNTIKGPKAYVTVAYASPTKNYSLEHVNDIKNTIRKFTKDNQNMVLSPSELTSRTNNTTPQPFLLSGLPKVETEALCDFRIFSTPTLTLAIFPVRIDPDDFLMTLTGFLLEPTKQNESFIKTVVTKALEHSPTIIDWFNRNQAHLHPKLALYPPIHIPKTIAASTQVHALTVNENGGAQIVWGIYIFPPTLDNKLAAEFKTLAKEIQYASIHGYGNAKRTDFQCGLCRGRDHPTAVCPMKTVHGFFNKDPNPSHPNNTIEPNPTVDPKTEDDDDTLFDIPENRNQSRGHHTLRTAQAPRGRGGPNRGRKAGRGLPK